MRIDIFSTTNKYKTIYADPPWMEQGGGKCKRGADRHYPLMKTSAIEALPVLNLSEANAHLYLWVTNNFLEDGLRVMKAWGFRYVTKITWVKAAFVDPMGDIFSLQPAGLGQYFRGSDEVCLFGVRGKLPYRCLPSGKRAQGSTVILAPRREHSRKPDEMRKQIEKVSYPGYVELFAREKFPGWDCWGNEIEEETK